MTHRSLSSVGRMVCAAGWCAATAALAQTTLSIAPDSPRWDRQGQVQPSEFQGRPCLMLDGGAAIVKDFELRDGVVDVDVATSAARGFFGIQFRIANDGADAEWVYLRQHKSGLPDALQYTPAASRNRVGRKGRNELVLALSELGGGWGFVCRWADEAD